MAVPKKRHSSSKAKRRKMHYYLETKELVKCESCGKEKIPHRVCHFCGSYRGRKVLEMKEKKERKEKEK
jgi:large subunit ribosomal protein L32